MTKLPSDLQGDLNLISNRLPSYWDLRTGIAQEILEKMKDVLIEETGKLMKIQQRNKEVQE